MWYKQQTVGIRPKDLETTISKFYNYVRKDIVETEQVYEPTGEIMKFYDYLEAKVLKEDWDLFKEIMNNTDKIDVNSNDISDNRQGLTETFEATLTNSDDVAINRQAIEELFEMITAESEGK